METSMPDEATAASVRGEARSQISTGLVQLHSQYYGKGPTKAKTHIVNDTVVCILQGGFTRVEHTLIETGRDESVHDIRRTFQQVMEEEFRRVVEQATGRKVVAYMSAVHTNPDLAVEIFMMEPGEEQAAEPTDLLAAGDGDGGPPQV
jgi:uncharacterized protein YbcI